MGQQKYVKSKLKFSMMIIIFLLEMKNFLSQLFSYVIINMTFFLEWNADKWMLNFHTNWILFLR